MKSSWLKAPWMKILQKVTVLIKWRNHLKLTEWNSPWTAKWIKERRKSVQTQNVQYLVKPITDFRLCESKQHASKSASVFLRCTSKSIVSIRSVIIPFNSFQYRHSLTEGVYPIFHNTSGKMWIKLRDLKEGKNNERVINMIYQDRRNW